jgi:hypothetical protein
MKNVKSEDGSKRKCESEGVVHMWQEMRGEPDWRIQTEDPGIGRKLSRKAGMRLVAKCVNCYFRVSRFQAASRNNARRTFRRVTGQTPLYDVSTRVHLGRTWFGGVIRTRRAA